MAILLMAEAMLFAGLISACMLLRARAETTWPPADQPRLPMAVTNVNVVVLLLSAYTLRRAKQPDLRRTALTQTLCLAVLFLLVQGAEWSRLLLHGAGAPHTPYTAVFYALIGTHALHVIAGIAILVWVRLNVASLYWYFVVGLWPILYVFIYF